MVMPRNITLRKTTIKELLVSTKVYWSRTTNANYICFLDLKTFNYKIKNVISGRIYKNDRKLNSRRYSLALMKKQLIKMGVNFPLDYENTIIGIKKKLDKQKKIKE
jgi:hypothetical protein